MPKDKECPFTVDEIREKFNFTERVKIIQPKDEEEVQLPLYTTITIGQLQAGLKIPLYDPARPLQYQVLSLISKAPGEMNGNFYRIINEFENYNKQHPEMKFSAEQIISRYHVCVIPSHSHGFCLKKKRGVVLPFDTTTTEAKSNDHNEWHRFPIFIRGQDWIHHEDSPPPPEYEYNPIPWRSLEKCKQITILDVSSGDDDLLVWSKRQKVCEARTPQVGTGGSSNCGGCDFSSDIQDERDSDSFQRVDAAHTIAAADDRGNSEDQGDRDPNQRVDTVITDEQGDNGDCGPWFEELEGESKLDRTGGWTDCIYIGNFPVKEKFASLYRKIWQTHGHLATRNVVDTDTFSLVVLVSKLLERIDEMETLKPVDMEASIIDKWKKKIEEAERLQFNVGWLRKHFDQGVKTINAVCSLHITREKYQEGLNSALERGDDLKVKLEEVNSEVCQLRQAIDKALKRVDDLKDQLEKVNSEVRKHRGDIDKVSAESEQYMTLFQQSFLHDAF